MIVDGARVPAGRVEYDYLDVVLNPEFGSVSVADPATEREAGAEWNATVNVWLASLPGGGRVPLGILAVGSDSLVVGSWIRTPDYSVLVAREPAVLGWAIVRFGGHER